MGTTQKSIRIRTDINNPQDQYLSVGFDRSIDLIEILSLKLPTKNLFRTFDSETGIVCGRVSANGVGLKNCNISLFIPKYENIDTNITSLSDANKIKIKTAELQYPFTTPNDTDNSGKRFNLLPKIKRNRFLNGFPFNLFGIGATPKTVVGSFSSDAEEISTNDEQKYINEKYYKYTTTTNESGDYMIYCKTGNYNIILELDITDLGEYSTTPALMSHALGYPEQMFEQNGTKIKADNNLDSLPNIFRQVTTVSVKPLWSNNDDLDSETIGITRQDFNVPIELKPSFSLFGNLFGMSKDSWFGDKTIFKVFFQLKCLCFGNTCSQSCNWNFDVGLDFDCIDILGKNFCIVPKLRFCIQTGGFIPFIYIRMFSISYCRLNNYLGIPDSGFFYLDSKTCIKADQSLSDITGDSSLSDVNESEDIQNLANISGLIDVFTLKRDSFPIDLNLKNVDDYQLTNDIELLDESQYFLYNKDGVIALNIMCNRRKMITSENGVLIDSDNDNGVYTEFDGFITIRPEENVINDGDKSKIVTTNIRIPNRKTTFNFKFNQLYSFKQYMGDINNTESYCKHRLGILYDCNSSNNTMFHTPGKIVIKNQNPEIYPIPNNNINVISGGDTTNYNLFSNNYLYYCVYFINSLIRKPYGKGKEKFPDDDNPNMWFTCPKILKNSSVYKNNKIIGGDVKNTQYFLNEDYIETDFLLVDKTDYINQVLNNNRGIINNSQYLYKGLIYNDSLKNVLNNNLI